MVKYGVKVDGRGPVVDPLNPNGVGVFKEKERVTMTLPKYLNTLKR